MNTSINYATFIIDQKNTKCNYKKIKKGFYDERITNINNTKQDSKKEDK